MSLLRRLARRISGERAFERPAARPAAIALVAYRLGFPFESVSVDDSIRVDGGTPDPFLPDLAAAISAGSIVDRMSGRETIEAIQQIEEIARQLAIGVSMADQAVGEFSREATDRGGRTLTEGGTVAPWLRLTEALDEAGELTAAEVAEIVEEGD